LTASLAFLSVISAMVGSSFHVREIAGCQRHAVPSRVLACAALALFVASEAGIGLSGLTQRGTVAVASVWLVLVCWRLLPEDARHRP
jgi:hypothetical protein